MNNDFGVTSDPKIIIYGNSCIILNVQHLPDKSNAPVSNAISNSNFILQHNTRKYSKTKQDPMEFKLKVIFMEVLAYHTGCRTLNPL